MDTHLVPFVVLNYFASLIVQMFVVCLLSPIFTVKCCNLCVWMNLDDAFRKNYALLYYYNVKSIMG